MFSCKGHDVANGVANGVRYRCLEWARLPDCRSEHDEQVEEDTENCEGGDDDRDGPTEVPHISSQGVSEKEKRCLHDKGEALHDEFKTPSDHPPHPELPVAAAVNEGSFDVEIEPLFPQHG